MPALKARGFLKLNCTMSGEWNWTRGGEPVGSVGIMVTTTEAGGRIHLHYAQNGETKDKVISLEAAPMKFGGFRWWAICPASGIRCGTLVYSRRYDTWVSIKASGYAYATQNADYLDRLKAKSEKAEKRWLGLSKYARQPTWERARNTYLEAEEAWEEQFARSCMKRFGRYL